jgi:IS30 family transposase
MNTTKERKELTAKDRADLEFGLKCKTSISLLAEKLGVSTKTIRREIKQGTVEEIDSELRPRPIYRAYYAQQRHDENVSRRGRKSTHSQYPELIKQIRDMMLIHGFSPDAIIGPMKANGLSVICTRTLYDWLERGYIQGLTHTIKHRKVKQKPRVGYKNPTAKRIDEHPQEANERQPNHWEMDLVVSGKGGKGCLLVMTERASRYELIFQLKDKRQESVIAVLDRLERRYKGKFKEKFKTITCDNGSEFLNSDGLEQSCIGQGQRTTIYYAPI